MSVCTALSFQRRCDPAAGRWKERYCGVQLKKSALLQRCTHFSTYLLCICVNINKQLQSQGAKLN